MGFFNSRVAAEPEITPTQERVLAARKAFARGDRHFLATDGISMLTLDELNGSRTRRAQLHVRPVQDVSWLDLILDEGWELMDTSYAPGETANLYYWTAFFTFRRCEANRVASAIDHEEA